MGILSISIQRPVLIISIVILMVTMGLLLMFRLPVSQFPNVDMPYVLISVIYPGAGPEETAELVAKPIEEEIRSISGLKNVISYSQEGVSQIWAQFNLDVSIDYAEEQVRSKVGIAKTRLPRDAEEPLIARYNISDQAVVTFALMGGQSNFELYEYADKWLRPKLEQVSKISQIKIFGGSKREIQVLLDRRKLSEYEISVLDVGQALQTGGFNIPLGKSLNHTRSDWQKTYRSLGEFNTLEKIENIPVKYYRNENPPLIKQLGKVIDSHEDEESRAFYNGSPAVVIEAYKQIGANTVEVAKNLKKRFEELSSIVSNESKGMKLIMLQDASKPIRDNINDVSESIILGILLTIIVVFFFLGNFRSTIITGIAIPNSLIGAFLLISGAGFSINMFTLMSLSLAVGLLIDDAIVVRENIFRHIELGKSPREAAISGTQEVMLAVIATTLAIMAVFGPIAFVGGITGRFIKEFGLTICFVMAISLFDALTVGPMLSAYFAGTAKKRRKKILQMWSNLIQKLVHQFNRFQDWLEDKYGWIIAKLVRNPIKVIIFSGIIALLGFSTVVFLPNTFMPDTNNRSMQVTFETGPGKSLNYTERISLEIDKVIRSFPEVDYTVVIAGDRGSDSTHGLILIELKPHGKKNISTKIFKENLRQSLSQFSEYKVKLNDNDIFYGGERPYNLKLLSKNRELLRKTATSVLEEFKKNPGFVEIDSDYRPGNPEIYFVYDEKKCKELSVSTSMAGEELRAQVEGITPVKFRQDGNEWNVRVRLQEKDRELQGEYHNIMVPNLLQRQVPLPNVTRIEYREGIKTINRHNGLDFITISADMASGYGIGDLMKSSVKTMADKKLLPPGVDYYFEGQSEQYDEMSSGMALAAVLAVLFIYLVLASLYNSFITPFSLLLPLPFAISGAFVALWLAKESLNIYSIIACIMLLGISAKNSILLVDYTNQLLNQGKNIIDAVVMAGRRRLRPILMTSMALVAGTIPIAIALNESAKERSSMGWVIIGGVVSSTLLSLIIVPVTLTLMKRKKGKEK